LAPQASTTCTATYTVTQADVNAGQVRNTATVSGTPPTGPAVTSPPATAVVTIPAGPALTIVKSVSPTSVGTAGEPVTYSFAVTNTGNVDLTAVTVTETAFSGTGTAPLISCPVTALAPGALTTCTATYTVTQADVNAGVVTNTATVSGTPPSGPAVTSPPSTAAVTIAAGPAITIVKSVTPTSVGTTGDQVTYSFDVTNTGNVTLTGVTVTETAFSGTGTPPVVSCLVTTLAPGASTTCTATYTVTQADVNAEMVTNTATVSGTPPTGPAVTSPPATAVVTIPAGPAITLVKSVTPTSVSVAGDPVTYSFEVANTGNVDLTAVTVTETAFSGTGTPPVVSCLVTTLPPGASTTCTATYTVTQTDVNAGVVTNTATVSGTPPSGPAVTSRPSTAVVTIPGGPLMTLDKTAGEPVDANGTGLIDAGDTIAYSFLITNTGNVSLTDIAVSDPTVGRVSCPAITLAPQASTVCTATYTITQADVDAGAVVNTATVTALPPPTALAPNLPTDSTITPLLAFPAIGLLKIVNRTGLVAGDTITYAFVATNIGNVTLTNVRITETTFSGTGALSPPACDRTVVTTLAPGEVIVCTATYEVTQADVDTGVIQNGAIAAGTPPTGPDVTDTDQVTVTEASSPAMRLSKRATVRDADQDRTTGAGDELLYQFDVTNTGNVTLAGATVHDSTLATAGIATSCPGVPLPPGQTMICQAVAPYVITPADVAAGAVSNTATAGATGPNGEEVVSPPVTLIIPVGAGPGPVPPPEHAGTLPVTGLPLRTLLAVALLLLVAGATVLSLTHLTASRRRYPSNEGDIA
jgi:uncharacterized repeat protein (TIGR01451 family)